ncbi:UNVERIFIED_CONTAM: hypothetical protein FKN15_037854 [Acipenser sinensis]
MLSADVTAAEELTPPAGVIVLLKHQVMGRIPLCFLLRFGALCSASALCAALRRFVQRFGALCSASALCAALRRFVQRFGALCSASALCAALRRFVQRFGALCSASALGAWCLGTWDLVLDARCTHLDALARDTRRVDAQCTHLDARCTHLDARRFGARRVDASTLGARSSTLDARTSTLDARTSTLDASALDAWRVDASTLGARTSTLDASALDASTPRRSVHAPRRSVHAPRRSVHAPRCLTLGARTSMLDTLGARTSTLDAPSMSCSTEMSGFHCCTSCQAKLPASDPHDECVSCLGPEHAASALADRAFCHHCARCVDAQCTHLDASAFRRSVHAPRRSTLRRSVRAPRRSTLRRSTRRRLGARCTHLDARCTHLDARRSVHAPRRSTLGARTSTLDTLGARTSTLDAPSMLCSTEMSGFHRCTSCQAKLPATDPHDECVACLGPEHAASALADKGAKSLPF